MPIKPALRRLLVRDRKLVEEPKLNQYTKLGPLVEMIRSDAVNLVRASYILKLARDPHGMFQRRQDLPPEAFADGPMLERLIAEVAEWERYLEMPDSPDWHAQALMRFPPFVIISYAWSAPTHPDKDGRQLREVLAPVIMWYMCERAKLINEPLGFENAPALLAERSVDGCDFGVFVECVNGI